MDIQINVRSNLFSFTYTSFQVSYSLYRFSVSHSPYIYLLLNLYNLLSFSVFAIVHLFISHFPFHLPLHHLYNTSFILILSLISSFSPHSRSLSAQLYLLTYHHFPHNSPSHLLLPQSHHNFLHIHQRCTVLPSSPTTTITTATCLHSSRRPIKKNEYMPLVHHRLVSERVGGGKTIHRKVTFLAVCNFAMRDHHFSPQCRI